MKYPFQQFKIAFIIVFLLVTTSASFSQTKADSISLTFPKVLFVNDKKEVLLGFDDNRKAYEVPSIGLINGPIGFKQYIDKIAKEVGLTYKTYRLGGLFTYVFPDKYRTFIRPYLVVQITGYVNGRLADTSYKWFSLKAATSEIKYPASSRIVNKVMKNPKQVWCATFEEHGYTNPIHQSKIVFRVIEDFYIIN
jgi:hypothetical protein